MPWSQTSPMDQRTQFIADYLREVLSITELCDLYGISRKSAYKWIERYLRQGPAGLEERSRRAHSSPRRAPVVIANQINVPQSGSFHASFTIRAASTALGGCGFGMGAAGGSAWCSGLTVTHFQRTARL